MRYEIAVIEVIERGGTLLAILVRRPVSAPGVDFVTPPTLSQQLGFMSHPAGRRIAPHVHVPVPRALEYTQEVLVVRSGKIRVDFFDEGRRYLESRVIGAGDTAVLVGGGHGFEVLEDVDIIEVKQGPYAGEIDKVRFEPAPFEPRIP
jgi:mannose-6-phosphate isomerase-like protein (cupin superfamily)